MRSNTTSTEYESKLHGIIELPHGLRDAQMHVQTSNVHARKSCVFRSIVLVSSFVLRFTRSAMQLPGVSSNRLEEPCMSFAYCRQCALFMIIALADSPIVNYSHRILTGDQKRSRALSHAPSNDFAKSRFEIPLSAVE